MGLNLNGEDENDADDEIEGEIKPTTKARRQSSTTTKPTRDLPQLKMVKLSCTNM